MSGGIDTGYGYSLSTKGKEEEKKQHQLSAIAEIDEMTNKGVIDKYEAARLKDQIMAA
ncbi:MAG: hypothetical protein Q8O41_05385 [Candidatus Methanoperedens sp.]|nr:hypothetical protein [Candidatus Methanoperedens sp.]